MAEIFNRLHRGPKRYDDMLPEWGPPVTGATRQPGMPHLSNRQMAASSEMASRSKAR